MPNEHTLFWPDVLWMALILISYSPSFEKMMQLLNCIVIFVFVFLLGITLGDMGAYCLVVFLVFLIIMFAEQGQGFERQHWRRFSYKVVGVYVYYLWKIK